MIVIKIINHRYTKKVSPENIPKMESKTFIRNDGFFLKNRPIHFHINRTIVIRPVKRNQLSFPSIEINKPLLNPVHRVSQIRFNFRSQFKLLPQIRCLITFRLESSIIIIDSNITYNIVRKVINVQQEKCRTANGALRETPASTGYPCEDLPSRTTRSRLLLRKEEIRPNI